MNDRISTIAEDFENDCWWTYNNGEKIMAHDPQGKIRLVKDKLNEIIGVVNNIDRSSRKRPPTE